MIYVAKSSIKNQTLEIIGEHMLEKNLTNVMIVEKSSIIFVDFHDIGEVTLERNLINVMNVARFQAQVTPIKSSENAFGKDTFPI